MRFIILLLFFNTSLLYSIEFIKVSETIINQDSKHHLAFTDIEKLPNNRLIVVYRQGLKHLDSSGKVVMQLGSLDGLSWDEPVVLVNDELYDCRDPSLGLLSDNSLILNFFKYNIAPDKLKPNIVHVFTSVSKDNGLTFSNPKQIDEGSMSYNFDEIEKIQGEWTYNNENIPIKATSSGVIEFQDNLLLPMYCKSPGIFGGLTLGVSSNNGESWNINELELGHLNTIKPNEPALLIVNPNLWIIQFRTQMEGGYTYQVISNDQGKTWHSERNLGFIGHSPELIKLDNGVLIAAYRIIQLDDKQNISTIQVGFTYSEDNGENWSKPIIIEDCGLVDCGYPGIVQLDENSFIISYYIAKKDVSVIKVAKYSFN